jgi:hypothetical protein
MSGHVCWPGSSASSFAPTEQHLIRKMFVTVAASFLNYVGRQAVKKQAICALRPLRRLWKARKRISVFVSKAAKNVANPSDQEDQRPKEPYTLPDKKQATMVEKEITNPDFISKETLV